MSNAKFVKEIRTEWIKEWTTELLTGLIHLVTSAEIETYCKGKLDEFIKLCSEKAIARAKQQGEDEATVNPTFRTPKCHKRKLLREKREARIKTHI